MRWFWKIIWFYLNKPGVFALATYRFRAAAVK